MRTVMNSVRLIGEDGTLLISEVVSEGGISGGEARRDHESGCRSRMRRRTEGGVARGRAMLSGSVDAISVVAIDQVCSC